VSSGEPSSTKPDLYVIARIIQVLKESGKMNRTALATSTSLAYDRLARYLEWMEARKFVRLDEEGAVVITDRGIETYDELVRWIMQYVGKLRFPKTLVERRNGERQGKEEDYDDGGKDEE